jgi:hypothetical protein
LCCPVNFPQTCQGISYFCNTESRLKKHSLFEPMLKHLSVSLLKSQCSTV